MTAQILKFVPRPRPAKTYAEPAQIIIAFWTASMLASCELIEPWLIPFYEFPSKR